VIRSVSYEKLNKYVILRTIDFTFLANYWGCTDCASSNDCQGADFDQDGDVDFDDLAKLVQEWLECNDPADPRCWL